MLPKLAPLLLTALLLAGVRAAGAWGTPHTEITRHALRALPAADRLEARLGGARQMEDLCWGADYRGYVHARYYVDDYLLFPGFPRHSSHLMPQVAETWEPYFRRTLQALRGESPQNAARWLGSFLHFVQDSGSPPHALPTGGVAHTRMENYVLALDVRLPPYVPREFASGEEGALADLERRMRALTAYSRERAERLLPLAERDERLACEPLVLECAQETMRAVADVTHALMVLSRDGPRPGTAAVRGTISAPVVPDLPLAPTKVLIEGTGYSTVADADAALPGDPGYSATFVLGDLPPGEHTLLFMRTGCRTLRRKLRLGAGETRTLRLHLTSDPVPGNLLRNPDFSVRWLRPGEPDHWTREGGGWRSDAFPVLAESVYAFGAADAAGERRSLLRVGETPDAAFSGEEHRGGRAEVKRGAYATLWVEGEQEPRHAWARREFSGDGSPNARKHRSR